LFWVLLAVVIVLFSTVNWTPVTITLWGGLEADVKLPVLLFAAFLIGFLPMLIIHRARMWSMRRRLEAHERQNAALYAPAAHETATVVPVSPVPEPFGASAGTTP
jgi:uncharacterized integral membrane protein